MHTALWVVQIILAVVFGLAGLAALISPGSLLPARPNGGRDLPPAMVRIVGIIEILCAAAMIIPGTTILLDAYTPWAAVALSVIMVGALFIHNRRREFPQMYINTALLAMSIFVAWGRFVYEPLLSQ